MSRACEFGAGEEAFKEVVQLTKVPYQSQHWGKANLMQCECLSLWWKYEGHGQVIRLVCEECGKALHFGCRYEQ
jgi:hypothetical protein